MAGAKISMQDLEKWASVLLNHSLGGVGKGDRVMVKGEAIAWPLMEVLERQIVEAGAAPDLNIVGPNNPRGRVWSAAMATFGEDEQMAAIPEWHRARYESMTKYIEILGHSDPSAFSMLDTKGVQKLASLDRPFANIRLSKRWVLTLFPTQAGAKMEGMDYEDYVRFVVKASTHDPGALLASEEALAPLVLHGKRYEVKTYHPVEERELNFSVSIEPSLPLLCYGLRNHPDGEVATSPDARTSEGEIFFDLPVAHGGKTMRGIYLRLENGVIVDYSAQEGGEQLAAIIETDAGSHRLGEIALGMNPAMDRVLKEALFLEKVGGTLHVAIGASYETCYVEDPSSPEGRAKLNELEAEGILNRSAQHVDIVTDFRPGGVGREVRIDGQLLVVRDNQWVRAD